MTADEIEQFSRGFFDCMRAYAHGTDVSTHRSQGTTPWDQGWNAYIDQLDRRLVDRYLR